jgi:hypothetical protein
MVTPQVQFVAPGGVLVPVPSPPRSTLENMAVVQESIGHCSGSQFASEIRFRTVCEKTQGTQRLFAWAHTEICLCYPALGCGEINKAARRY